MLRIYFYLFVTNFIFFFVFFFFVALASYTDFFSFLGFSDHPLVLFFIFIGLLSLVSVFCFWLVYSFDSYYSPDSDSSSKKIS